MWVWVSLMQSSLIRGKKGLAEPGYCDGLLCHSRNVHFIFPKPIKFKDVKAENDPFTHRFDKTQYKWIVFLFEVVWICMHLHYRSLSGHGSTH